jgi:DNA-binding NtrC family response regulator
VGKALAGGRVLPKTGLSLVNLGRARVVQELRQRLEQVARLRTPALMLGEAGSGFELCARHLHIPNTPWLAPEDTEWLASNPFEPLNEARDGTLFLPEIANLNKAEQKGLVQVLGKLEKFNVRLICAATGPLAAMAEDGRYDSHLYNQLSGLTIRLPSLAEHAEDIPDIATDDAHAARRRERSAAALAHRRRAQRHAQPQLAGKPSGAAERGEDARAHDARQRHHGR